jgi:hypothetical protein
MLVGGLGATLLWYGVLWARTQIHEANVISVDGCEVSFVVKCIAYEPPAPVEPALQPCKAWLADDRAGMAALSQCLHDARRGREAEHINALERTRAIATSS